MHPTRELLPLFKWWKSNSKFYAADNNNFSEKQTLPAVQYKNEKVQD